MELDLTKFYTVTQTDIETDPDAVLAKAKHGCSPILIKSNDGNDMLLFSWDDYFDRFGCLYTEKELKEIDEACRRNSDDCGT